MTGEYKVYPTEDKKGYIVYWCPSAPVHYNDKVPYDGKVYPQKQAAYRRRDTLKKKLEEARKQDQKAIA